MYVRFFKNNNPNTLSLSKLYKGKALTVGSKVQGPSAVNWLKLILDKDVEQDKHFSAL